MKSVSSLIKVLVCFSLILTVSACSMNPVYTPEETQATAQLNVEEIGNSWMCVDSKKYTLKKGAEDYATIPAGKRVTIGNYFSWESGVRLSYYCEPAVSFIPAKGGSYFVSFDLINETCILDIYKEGADNRIGLDIEPSLAAPEC